MLNQQIKLHEDQYILSGFVEIAGVAEKKSPSEIQKDFCGLLQRRGYEGGGGMSGFFQTSDPEIRDGVFRCRIRFERDFERDEEILAENFGGYNLRQAVRMQLEWEWRLVFSESGGPDSSPKLILTDVFLELK